MQLRSAILYVKDLEHMKRFYGEVLGSRPSKQGWTDTWAAFETGGLWFSLHAIPAEIAKSIEIESPPIPREEHPMKLVFEVKDVELERERLEALEGAQILRRLGRNRERHATPLILRVLFFKSAHRVHE